MTQAAELTEVVNSFIENTTSAGTSRTGGEFWPIVKQVRLFLPRCRVLRCGAVLVDLPGTRDSNAARDKIAKQVRLQSCCSCQCHIHTHVHVQGFPGPQYWSP